MYIGYSNTLTMADATVSASTEAAGFEKENTYSWRTTDFWKATAVPAWVKTTATGSPEVHTCDYFAMYAHDMTGSATVVLQYSDNDADWTNAFTAITPTDNTPIMKTFTSSSHKYWRVYVTGAVSSIGVVSWGELLNLPVGLDVGHAPAALAAQYMSLDSVSVTGEFIGRSVYKKPISTSLNVPGFLTDTWVRTYWNDFLRHIEKYPFFVIPQDEQPDEVMFAWTTSDINTPYYATTTHFGVTIDLLCRVS